MQQGWKGLATQPDGSPVASTSGEYVKQLLKMQKRRPHLASTSNPRCVELLACRVNENIKEGSRLERRLNNSKAVMWLRSLRHRLNSPKACRPAAGGSAFSPSPVQRCRDTYRRSSPNHPRDNPFCS